MAEGRKAASLAAWMQRGQQEGSETQGICVVQGSEAGSGGEASHLGVSGQSGWEVSSAFPRDGERFFK